MEKEFDFNDMGKKMPYKLPEGYFEKSQQEIFSKTTEKKPSAGHHRWIYAVAAVAVILIGVALWNFMYQPAQPSASVSKNKVEITSIDRIIKKEPTDKLLAKVEQQPTATAEAKVVSDKQMAKADDEYMKTVDSQLNNMSDDELQSYADFTEDDIFINQ